MGKKISEQTKPSINKHIVRENRVVVMGGEGLGEDHMGRGVNCMVRDGN